VQDRVEGQDQRMCHHGQRRDCRRVGAPRTQPAAHNVLEPMHVIMRPDSYDAAGARCKIRSCATMPRWRRTAA
jgi:hypothetical protein